MSSTTIRYSGVPENSHSRDFDPGHHDSDDRADSASDLTLRWRNRVRAEAAAAASASNPITDPAPAPAPAPSWSSAPAPAPASASASAPSSTPSSASNPGNGTANPVRAQANPIRFTPGKAGPSSSDRRHNRAFPHPQNPGLLEQPDGYYDWADRRLYLSDGSPDPLTPGAYRYQTRPDLCDLDAPDSDPSSPRYEPEHLRHRPGDTWIIDRARPYDVLDPGPFGSPGWFPDRRTGRHRRDELPDPIPWWEVEEEPEKAEWADNAESLWLRRTRITREREALAAAEAAPRNERHRHEDASDRPSERGGPEDPPDASGTPRPPGPPGPPDRPGPPGGSGTTGPGYPDEPEEPRRHFDQPHRFNKLREDAWTRFIEKSEPLAAAHHGPVRSPDRLGRNDEGSFKRRMLRPWKSWRGLVRGIVTAVTRTRPAPSRPVPAPKPASVPIQRQRSVIASDRHTHLALRTARFAGAVRGAQRARVETTPAPPPVPGPAAPPPQVEVHWQTRPRTESRCAPRPAPQLTSQLAAHLAPRPRQPRPSPGPAGSFMSAWEHRFDQSTGGAAWA